MSVGVNREAEPDAHPCPLYQMATVTMVRMCHVQAQQEQQSSAELQLNISRTTT